MSIGVNELQQQVVFQFVQPKIDQEAKANLKADKDKLLQLISSKMDNSDKDVLMAFVNAIVTKDGVPPTEDQAKKVIIDLLMKNPGILDRLSPEIKSELLAFLQKAGVNVSERSGADLPNFRSGFEPSSILSHELTYSLPADDLSQALRSLQMLSLSQTLVASGKAITAGDAEVKALKEEEEKIRAKLREEKDIIAQADAIKYQDKRSDEQAITDRTKETAQQVYSSSVAILDIIQKYNPGEPISSEDKKSLSDTLGKQIGDLKLLLQQQQKTLVL